MKAAIDLRMWNGSTPRSDKYLRLTADARRAERERRARWFSQDEYENKCALKALADTHRDNNHALHRYIASKSKWIVRRDESNV